MLSREERHKIEGRISYARAHRDYEQALLEIARLLADESAGMKALALFYRGEVNDDQGHFEEAKQDWLTAIEYEPEGTFLRCHLHHRLAVICEKMTDTEGANGWYRMAMHSCAVGEKFSCPSTLIGFIRNNSGSIASADRDLTASALSKSWSVLDFPGKPDLTDLPASINRLDAMFQALIVKTLGEP
jgi:tetratricopeptide (TPR) repeat protein